MTDLRIGYNVVFSEVFFMKKIKILSGTLPLFIFSIIISWGVILLTGFLSSLAVYYTANPLSFMWVGALLSTLVSAIISGILVTKFFSGGKIMFSALVAICVSLTMLILSLILSGGKIVLSGIMNYISFFGVFLLSSYLAKGKRKRHR